LTRTTRNAITVNCLAPGERSKTSGVAPTEVPPPKVGFDGAPRTLWGHQVPVLAQRAFHHGPDAAYQQRPVLCLSVRARFIEELYRSGPAWRELCPYDGLHPKSEIGKWNRVIRQANIKAD